MRARKIIGSLAAVVTALCSLFALGGCAAESKAPLTEYVVTSYEEYSSLYKTVFDVFGKVTLNEDKRFVTDGKKSAKIEFVNSGYDAGSAAGNDKLVNRIGYYTLDFPTFSDMSTFAYFSVDVYNDSDYEFDLFLSTVSESDASNCYLGGGVLAARQWNHLVFDVNGYFFADKPNISKFEFMILGVDKTGEPKTTLYLDNVRVAMFDGAVKMPEYTPEKKISYDGIELLGFDTVDDLKFVNMSTPHSYDWNDGWASMTLDPSAQRIFGRAAMRVEMYAMIYDNESLWEKDNEYRIAICPNAVRAARGAKTVNLKCHNPDTQAKRVRLTCAAGARVTTATVDVGAGETVLLVYDDAAVLQDPDSIEIAVDAWNFGGKATLYLSGLHYTV